MELTPTGLRVLGCLIEKALATPQQYPLSVNALQAACNQRTGRDPVVDYDEDTVRAGLDDLKQHELVKAEYARGSRTPKYAHRLDEQLDIDEASLAVLAVLMLRGPQTPGELRGRTERLHAFDDLEAVDRQLETLAGHKFGPLAVLLPRAPGQKEARWGHLLGAHVPETRITPDDRPPESVDTDLATRVEHLETRVRYLSEEFAELRAAVDRLRDQAGA